MKGSYKYILFFLTLLTLNTSAQEDNDDLPNFYMQDSVYTVRNALKIDPVQILFGDFRLYYERRITNHFSAEIGAGITRRNYTSGWFDDDLDNLGDNIDIKTGASFSFSVRRYFKDSEELDGTYLALGVNHRWWTKDINVIDTNGTATDFSFRDERRSTSVILKFGYQALPISSNVFADFFTGPAIRFKNYDIVQTTSANDPLAYSIENLNEVTFGWELGVRIGFGF
ncbi:MAG: hypothetical protein AAGC47_00665 [Bacteroidota bacterium]